MAAYLTDGREIIVPLSFFPDIKQLSVKEREGWMILEWLDIHRDELMANWENAQNGDPLERIAPLK